MPVARVPELPARSCSREGIAGGPFSSGSIGSVSGVRSVAAGYCLWVLIVSEKCLCVLIAH
jgi:hypothetical protein